MVLRYTVTISRVLNTAGAWNVSFPQVSFVPDEVIIKGVSVLNTAAAVQCVNIHSNLINEYMFSFAVDASVSAISQAYDIHHQLSRPVNTGSYVFRALNAADNSTANTNTTVSFQLEFIKH